MEKKMKSADTREANAKNLPQEVIWEILSWLPDPKPLVRFKCVSKLWLDAIEGQWFIRKHSSKHEVRHVMKDMITTNQGNEELFYYVMSMHGLILEQSFVEGKYRIINPYIKHVLDLPDPIKSQYLQIRMIYSLSERKYKVLYHYHKKDETYSGGIQILTVEAGLIWRNLDIPELSYGTNEKTIRKCILIGNVFFILRIDEDYQQMVCIEIENERFSVLKNIPESAFTSAGSASVTCWNMKPAIVKMHGFTTGAWKLNVWILEDYKKQRWAQSKISINLSSINKYFPEDKNIKLLHFIHTTLCFCVDTGQKFISCVINDTDKIIDKPVVRSMAPGYHLIGCYTPTMVCLQGMKAEDRQVMSDYKIIQGPSKRAIV